MNIQQNRNQNAYREKALIQDHYVPLRTEEILDRALLAAY